MGVKQPGNNQGGQFKNAAGGHNPSAGQGERPGPQPQPGPGPDRMVGERASVDNPPPSNRAMGAGVRNANTLLSRPISRRSSGEVVKRFREAMKVALGQYIKPDFENGFKLSVLDNTIASVGPLSALLMYHTVQVGGQYYCAVFTMLIEGSGNGFDRRAINLGDGGQQAMVDTVAGDVYNDDFKGRLYDHVMNEFGTDSMHVEDAGVMVIPEELDPEDEDHIRQIAFTSSQACFTVMENAVGSDQPLFSISMIDKSKERLTSQISFASNNDVRAGRTESATGQPIRSDINLLLESSVVNQQSALGFDERRQITKVDGFIDLVFSPPQNQQMFNAYAPQQSQNPNAGTQHYYPRWVMTRVDSEIDAITMELQLLAIAQSTILTTNMTWAGVYRSRHNVKGMDLKDIGAIGYELNVANKDMKSNGTYHPIDTKANAFDDNALFQLLSATVRDSLIFSMDIEETGELSWIHHAFIAAANGNEQANRLILDAANALTDNHFGRIFPGGQICTDDDNRIHLGYYIDDQGQHRDLRDLDYLAMLNLLGERGDLKGVEEWSETFDNLRVPLARRLERRADMIRAVFGGGVHIKGYARRITFTHEFITALYTACAEDGLRVEPGNMTVGFQSQGQRGNFNVGQYGVGGMPMGGMFTPQGGGGGNYTNSFGGFQGRFGGLRR